MNEDVGSLNLYQRLAKIRQMSDVVKKQKEGYKYTYIDILEVLANVQAGMKKFSVSLVPELVHGTCSIEKNDIVETKVDKTGKPFDKKSTEMLFSGDMFFTWVNDDNPEERIRVPWFITASMADPAQALGSGLTYTLRQFLTSYFQIAQTDYDIDAYRSKQKEAEEAESVKIAGSIISDLDAKIRLFLSENPDRKDEVAKFASQYAKRGNYLGIKNPELAAKMAKDFEQMFGNGDK